MKNRMSARIPALAFLFIAIASVGSANSQSKDRDNPTRLTSNEISGVIDSDSRGNFYYYSFMGGPGEVSVTLTVEPGRASTSVSVLTSVEVKLFDRNAEDITSKYVSTTESGGAGQAVARVEVTRRQLLVLSIKIPDGVIFKTAGGRYRIRLSGAVNFDQATPSTSESSANSIDKRQRANPKSGGITAAELQAAQDENLTDELRKLLPKDGILRMKMKDGAIRRIDLSRVEEITIEHEQ